MSKIKLKYEYPISKPQTEVKVVDGCDYRYYDKSKTMKYYMSVGGEMISVSNKTDKVTKLKPIVIHPTTNHKGININQRMNLQSVIWLELFYPNSNGSIHFKNGDNNDFTIGNVTLITPMNIKLDENEEMKTLRGYEDYYITNFGRVFSFKRVECKLIGSTDNNGYRMVNVGKEVYKVHRLVGKYFVSGESDIRKYVHHKNHNKMDNHFSNLEWVSQKENINYYYQHKSDNKQSTSV